MTNADNTNAHFKSLPGAVDIAPTLLRHLDVPVPDEVKEEMDGVPLIGKIAIDNLRATRKGDEIMLTWRKLPDATGTADVFVTTGNNFKSGGKDNYKKIATVNVGSESATIKVPPLSTKSRSAHDRIVKIILKTTDNWCNTWVVDR